MVNFSRTVFFMASILMVSHTQAATLSCPPAIDIDQNVSGAAPQGWAVLNQAIQHAPEFVEFFETDPHNQGSLTPTKTSLSGNVGYAVWDFAGDGTDLWLGCDYNHSTIMLYRPLPPTVKTCRVTYAPGGVVTDINCK